MRKYIICLGISIVLGLRLLSSPIYAQSQTYKDYLFQFDRYRQAYAEFKIAKNEYDKFKTLTSETTALEKTKVMIAVRDELLRTYLLMLNEKVDQNPGFTNPERQIYKTILANEITFLEKHAQLIPSVGSLYDAKYVSEQLESHYDVLSVSVRQVLVGLNLGSLAQLAGQFDATLADIRSFIDSQRALISNERLALADRWLLSISSKRTIYQQKIESITKSNSDLNGSGVTLDQKFADTQKNIGEARLYLLEASANVGELLNVLKYEQ